MGAIRYRCPIRLVPTYIIPAKEIRFFWKFQPDSFKTERQVCAETDGHTDRRTWLGRLVSPCWSRIYILYGVGNVSFTALQTSDRNHNTLCKGIKITPKSWDSFLAKIIWKLMENGQSLLINRLLYPTEKHFDKFNGGIFRAHQFSLL